MSMIASPGAMAPPRVYAPEDIRRGQRALAVLLALGVASLAAVGAFKMGRDDDQQSQKCGAFTIGESAIGGCDTIGR